MAEAVLPGVSIDVRAEALIVPGRITVGRLGVVGTASKGLIGVPVILGSYTDAREAFGDYDTWDDGLNDELTLVRALELAYANGATTAFAVRVASTGVGGAAAAAVTLESAGGGCARLIARSEGTWGNGVEVSVGPAEENAFIAAEDHPGTQSPVTLLHVPVPSARTRVRWFSASAGVTRSLTIVASTTPAAGEVHIDAASRELTFGDDIEAGDRITVSYLVGSANAVKVTVGHGRTEEVYTVLDGSGLVAAVNDRVRPSALVTGTTENLPAADELPSAVDVALTGGANGESGADYRAGLALLLNEAAHIIVAAGQDESFADELDGHCQNASSDTIKRDRIAVVGTGVAPALEAYLDTTRGHSVFSDRIILVAPGIKATDTAATPPTEVTLPGSYTAAAVAGLLAKLPAHFSPTNKTLIVGGLSHRFTPPQLAQLVESRVLVIEERQGFRVVKGITTTDPPFHQITTRRIVDYAKFGVRSAANPYIGLLNNDRVRGAMHGTINGFLTSMMKDEMLVGYDLEVTATREEERQGIARVTMVLRPVFSIDFITVTMFLE